MVTTLFCFSHLVILDSHNCCATQNADKKGLSEIAEDVKTLADKAKKNSLKPADYEVKNNLSVR